MQSDLHLNLIFQETFLFNFDLLHQMVSCGCSTSDATIGSGHIHTHTHTHQCAKLLDKMQLSSAGLLQAVIKGLSEHVGGGAAETAHENTQHTYKNGDYIQPRLKSLCGGGTTVAYIMIPQLNPAGTIFVGQHLHLFFHRTSKISSCKVGAVTT